MGNVPSWIGAGSLLLAFRIFLRDRSRSDRAQVEAVGIWGGIQRRLSAPGIGKDDYISFQMQMKNSSDLPIEVHVVAYRIQTRWIVPWSNVSSSATLVRNEVAGKTDIMRFVGAVGLAPQEKWNGELFRIDLRHTAPADDAGLTYFSHGVKCVIEFALIVDNAGRRWEARQGQGKFAKRIRWYSRSREHYPADWQSPAWRRVRTFKANAKVRALAVSKRIGIGERDSVVLRCRRVSVLAANLDEEQAG